MSETELAAYIHSLTPQERTVLKIAHEHLESSFDLGTSLGFLKWQAEQPRGQAEQPRGQAEQPRGQAEQPGGQAEQPTNPSPAPKRKRRRLIRRKPTSATRPPSS